MVAEAGHHPESIPRRPFNVVITTNNHYEADSQTQVMIVTDEMHLFVMINVVLGYDTSSRRSARNTLVMLYFPFTECRCFSFNRRYAPRPFLFTNLSQLRPVFKFFLSWGWVLESLPFSSSRDHMDVLLRKVQKYIINDALDWNRHAGKEWRSVSTLVCSRPCTSQEESIDIDRLSFCLCIYKGYHNSMYTKRHPPLISENSGLERQKGQVAYTASTCHATKILLLTTVDGIYAKSRKSFQV